MMVLVIVAALLSAIMIRFSIWRTSYTWDRKFTQVQHSVAALLYAGGAYYYGNCKNVNQGSSTMKVGIPLDCKDDLVIAGAFKDVDQCTAAMQNSWGPPLQVEIIQVIAPDPSPDPSGSNGFYQVQVQGDFSNYPQQKSLPQLAQTFGAEYSGGTIFKWTRVPSNSVINQGIWYRVPGNYLAVTNTNEIGGTRFSLSMELLNAELRRFGNNQPYIGPNPPVPYAGRYRPCPD
jgi:hypothetical protein